MAKINLSRFIKGEKGFWFDPDKAFAVRTMKGYRAMFLYSTMYISINFKKSDLRVDEFVEYVTSGNVDISSFEDSIQSVKAGHTIY